MAKILAVDIRGKVSSIDTLNAFIKGANTEEILDSAYAILLNRIRTRFQQEIDPSGTPWIPSQASIDENRNTLIKTGRLFRSIQLFSKSFGQRVIGTDVPYAPYLHYGIKGGKRWQFMGYNEQDESLIIRMIQDRFKGL